MTNRSWRENLPDLRQMAIWVLEKGKRQRAREQVQTFVLAAAGSEIELVIGRHVSVELDRCQLHIRDRHAKWKGALGFKAPEELIVHSGQLTAFGETDSRGYEGMVHRPFQYEAMERLDAKRQTKKSSPYVNQHDVIYFAYWYLLYGDLVGDAMFKHPVDPSGIFDAKIEAIYDRHSVPHTYLNNPTDRFATDYMLAKLVADE